MNLRNMLLIFWKDVKSGPRGIYFIWIVAFPFIITLVIRLVFGGLFDPDPRLAIVDQGSSEITEKVVMLDDIEVTVLESAEELKEEVEAHNFDAGLVLQEDFDAAVKAGRKPPLQFYISGESLASNRIVLSVTAVDLVRDIAGRPAPIEVETQIIGDGTNIPIEDRMIPLLVLFAVSLSGLFIPAASMIQERESKTITAVLITPAATAEFMTAKGLMGFLLAVIEGVLILILNLGVSAALGANLVIIAVAALMCVPIGLITGAAVKDMATMFGVWKSGAIILFAPAVLFLFPSVPDWIAKLFPTYYFLGPLYSVNIDGLPLTDVFLELGIALVISAVLLAAAIPVSRRMEQRLAIA
jgi:ABC-2 type transport system permease protein